MEGVSCRLARNVSEQHINVLRLVQIITMEKVSVPQHVQGGLVDWDIGAAPAIPGVRKLIEGKAWRKYFAATACVEQNGHRRDEYSGDNEETRRYTVLDSFGT